MHITTVGTYAITLGWVLALFILLLTVIFLIVGMPNPQTPLLLIGGLALARML